MCAHDTNYLAMFVLGCFSSHVSDTVCVVFYHKYFGEFLNHTMPLQSDLFLLSRCASSGRTAYFILNSKPVRFQGNNRLYVN